MAVTHKEHGEEEYKMEQQFLDSRIGNLAR